MNKRYKYTIHGFQQREYDDEFFESLYNNDCFKNVRKDE